MATFLCLHGAWHGGWCWDEVANHLKARDHRVIAPDLPGMSAASEKRAGAIRLQDHIEFVVSEVDRVGAEPLVVVAHSYAGMLGRAIELLRPQHLRHVVYLEAVVPGLGKSLVDAMPAGASATIAELRRDTADGPVLSPPNVEARFGISDGVLAARLQALPQPLHTLTDPLPRCLPQERLLYERTYVFASDRLPNPYQPFIDRFARDTTWQVIGVNGGHEMMLTNPSVIAEICLRAAQ